MLRGWAKQLDGGGQAPSTPSADPAEELRRLRRQLEVVTQERDFLKKAAAFVAQESR